MPTPAASPRLASVIAHARELIDIGERLGARGVCLCGSVARGTDREGSDLDFFVREFDVGDGTPMGRIDARRRANQLVDAYCELPPYRVDVRGIPGWLLGAEYDATTRRDSLPLKCLARET